MRSQSRFQSRMGHFSKYHDTFCFLEDDDRSFREPLITMAALHVKQTKAASSRVAATPHHRNVILETRSSIS